MIAVLFPGQGAQYVGMGADLFDSGPAWLGEQANEILGWDLAAMCLEGPEDLLTRTEHAQPALYGLSVALWELASERLARAGVTASAMAGHSLGEYSALAAAGAISAVEGLRLVAERGRAMAGAADATASGMAALIGASPESAEELSAARRSAGGSLWVANLNAPGQIVVAGGDDDIAWATDEARSFGIRRVIPLAVAGAFHTPFMEPARQRLAEALAQTSFGASEPPVWSNVTAQPIEPETTARILLQQIVSPVRFHETLDHLASSGITTFVHVGPGDVTAGLARRSVDGANVVVINDMAAIESGVDQLVSLGTMPTTEEA